MKYRWFAAVAGLAIAIAVSYHYFKTEKSRKPIAGIHSVAPEFTVTTISGDTVDLASYRGKVVLLDFWATWCDPCRNEIPHFIQLQEKYQNEGFQIIGISMDDEDAPVRQFYRDFHMNYPVALGGARLGELYGGVFGLPIAFVIGRKGDILSKHVGATPPSTLDREILTALNQGSKPGS